MTIDKLANLMLVIFVANAGLTTLAAIIILGEIERLIKNDKP